MRPNHMADRARWSHHCASIICVSSLLSKHQVRRRWRNQQSSSRRRTAVSYVVFINSSFLCPFTQADENIPILPETQRDIGRRPESKVEKIIRIRVPQSIAAPDELVLTRARQSISVVDAMRAKDTGEGGDSTPHLCQEPLFWL